MSDEEREAQRRAALEIAIMQWTFCLIDTYLEDRPEDREWCNRDLANAE